MGLPASVWLLLTAAVAVAAFVSVKTTPAKTATATSVGAVDVGDLETLGFLDDAALLGLAPGDSVTGCGIVTVDSTGVTDPGDFRLYMSAAATGGLADFLTEEVRYQSLAAVVPAGRETCPGGPPTETAWTGTLTTVSTTFANFGSGVVLPAPPAGVMKSYRVRVRVSLPDTPEVQSGAAGLTADFGGLTFENRG